MSENDEMSQPDLSVDGDIQLGMDAASILVPPRDSGRLGQLVGIALNYWELRKTPSGLKPIMVFTVLGFFAAAQATAVGVFGYAGPSIAQDLHFTLQKVIGLIVTVDLILLVAGVFFGWYMDRHPRAIWVGIGNLVYTIMTLIRSSASDYTSFSVPLTAGAVAGKAADVPVTSLISDYYPPETRARIFSLYNGVSQVSLIAATVLGGLAISKFGWRPVTLILTVPIGLAAFAALGVLREPVRGYFERRAFGLSDEEARKEDPPMSLEESFRAVLSVRVLRRLFFADLMSGIGSPVIAIFSIFMLADYYGLDAFGRAMVFLPALVTALIGLYIGGGSIDFLSRRSPGSVLRLVGTIGLVGVVGDILIALALPLPYFIVFNTLITFAVAVTRPATFAITSQVIPPNTRTLGLSLLSLASGPGTLTLSLFGILQLTYGYSAALLAAVPFIFIGAVIQLTAADYFESDRSQQIIGAAAAGDWKRGRKAAAAAEAKSATPAKPAVLLCRKVDVAYNGTQVLFGVDFEVREGEIVALLGTNGAGKSTLLRAISGTQQASGGAIIFDGRDITHMPANETAALGIVHMPGGRGTFGGLSVRDNLELGSWLETDRKVAAEKLAQLYELFPVLKAKAGLPSSALSGGEQQMVSLGQAFLSKPKLLMIDELSLGLSPAVVGELLKIIKQIQEQGTAVVIVEQSVNVALTVAARAAFMEKGEVKFEGPTADLLSRPDILRAVYVKGTASVSTGQAVATESARRRREQELDSATPVLEVEGIVKRFGGVTALDGVGLTLRQGEVLGLIGPNGSGKTTLIDIVSGELNADAGTVRYKGEDITSLPAQERARRKLVRRFQDANLFPSLTVYETLLVALDQRLEVRNPIFSAIALPQARRAERRLRVRADALLELLALTPYRDKFVSELSTGLRRILDLAFVLAMEADVLLLDEPSSGIAQAEAESLAPLIRRIRFETNCSILIIEHDIPLISAVSDELIAMHLGQVVLRGSADQVLGDPRVVESFLGGSEAAIQRSGVLV